MYEILILNYYLYITTFIFNLRIIELLSKVLKLIEKNQPGVKVCNKLHNTMFLLHLYTYLCIISNFVKLIS